MQANFPGFDFLGTALKFRKRKKISSSLVYARPQLNMKIGFSRGSQAVTAKKCTKKRDAHANLLFCLIN